MKEVIMKVPSFSTDYPKAPIYVADLVRCKECWHGTDMKNGKKFSIRCDIMDDLLMLADGYCNFGERDGE